MALSAELMQRLDADEPLPKRLKLAKNAYCSAELAVTRKEDLIVAWLCNVAPTSPIAWSTLALCISSQDSNSRTILKPEVKEKLITTLLETLKNDEKVISDEVLQCCSWVLTNTGMQHYFKNKLKKYGMLLRHLFTNVARSVFVHCEIPEDSANDAKDSEAAAEKLKKLSDHQYRCVVTAIESINQLNKQLANKDELANIFLDNIFGPLCTLIDPTCIDSSNRIGAESYKCIQQVLFGKARYHEYKENNKENENSIPIKLYLTISRITESADASVVPVIFGYIFRAAAGSYRGETVMLDDMFRRLVNCGGKFKTIALISLIESLNHIPLEFSNKIDELTLTEFFCNIVDEILSCLHLRDTDYNLLLKITNLNPLVIENKLPDVLKKVLLEKKSNESEKSMYASLMTTILDASVRLRREHKIIPWLLLSLKESLDKKHKSNVQASQIFSKDFGLKFTSLVSALNSSQVTVMLRSLMFHLKADCVDKIDDNLDGKISLMAECTVNLLVNFLAGIRIFEHSVPLATQQKFAKAFAELGEILSEFSKKVLNTTHLNRIMIVLMEATLSWGNAHSLLVTYVPKAEPEKMLFPISTEDFQQLIERVTNFGDDECRKAANNLLLHRIKTSLLKKSKVKLSSLIGGLRNSWILILERYSEIIHFFNLKQMSELASLIVDDLISDESGVQNWEKILTEENVQENKIFNIALLCHTLTRIGTLIEVGVTTSISSKINVMNVLEEVSNDAAISALNEIKIREDVEWSKVDDRHFSTIERCLQTLLRLPLKYFNVSFRTLTFIAIYTLSKECAGNEKIKTICDEILSDALEEGGLNLFDFIDPVHMIEQLPESKVIRKVFEMSLRCVETSTTLKRLINASTCPHEATLIIFSCVEKIKPKLNNEQKVAFKKVEKKLAKRILNSFGESLKTSSEIRSLTLTLKLAIARNNIKESLKNLVGATLRSLFVLNNVKEQETRSDEKKTLDEDMINEGLELAVVVLRRRADFDVSEELLEKIWQVVLKHPQVKVMTPLLELSVPKIFDRVLKSLHDGIMKGLEETSATRLTNNLVVWDCILKTDMGAVKNKCRLNAIRKLFQSLQIAEIDKENWPEVVKLLEKTVTAKHLHLSGENIDMIILVAGRSLRKANLLACDDVLTLCVALLRSRVEIMTDRLPPLLLLYRQAVAIVTTEARKSADGINKHELGLFALNVEKVSNSLVRLKKDMVRVSPYLIADLVHLFSEGNLQPEVKEPLKNCIFNLLTICDSHGVALLSRGLPTATREIFKGLNDTYNKFHRFTGKI